MSDRLGYWTDEDAEYYYVEVADEADQIRAGQRIARQEHMALIALGRSSIRTQDCECVPTTEACEDDDEHKPCVVRTDVVCWAFEAFDVGFGLDELDDWLRDARDRATTSRPFRYFLPAGIADPFADPSEPQPIPVAPGQVEAGL